MFFSLYILKNWHSLPTQTLSDHSYTPVFTLMEQTLFFPSRTHQLPLPHARFCSVRVAWSLVFCELVCRLLFVVFFNYFLLPNVLSVFRFTALYYPFRIFNMIQIDYMNKTHLFLFTQIIRKWSSISSAMILLSSWNIKQKSNISLIYN